MTTLFVSMLQGQAAPQGGGMTSMLLMMVVLFAIIYFFMIRPQNKRQKMLDKYRNELQPGADVVTVGGIRGTVKRINQADGTIVVNVATGVDITFEKSAIMPPAGEKKA